MDGIALDVDADVPLQRQLVEALRDRILGGVLSAGERVPSSRALAAQLKVGRNTVIAAYEQLTAEGYLVARRGDGTRVAALPAALLRAAGERRGKGTGKAHVPRYRARPPSSPAPVLSDRGRALTGVARPVPDAASPAFQSGLPALDRFPHALWGRIVARHFREPRTTLLGYNDKGGLPALKAALAQYLGPARGVVCEPEQIIIIGSAQAALDYAARTLLDPGDRVWLEDPGYMGARGALTGAGATLGPVPVDEEGLAVDTAVERYPHARLAYVCPSFQYPLGVTLSLTRRLALLDWAESERAWIVEDDYDSEFRYRGRPLGALHALDGGRRVIYLGTLSKTMYPGLRLGYLVVPHSLAERFAHGLRHTGQDAPLQIQAAVADFIDEGHYAAHVRRMRSLYAERQAMLVAEAKTLLGGRLNVHARDGGMQLPALADTDVDDVALSKRLAERGVSAAPLSGYALLPAGPRGLLLGYAAVDAVNMRWGLGEIARALGVE